MRRYFLLWQRNATKQYFVYCEERFCRHSKKEQAVRRVHPLKYHPIK